MIETKVVLCANQREVDRNINSLQHKGWQVVSVNPVDQGYSAAKTGCFGCLFLPLALLGKKKPAFQVTFQRGR